MKLEIFKEIVSEAGYELESYSGRGMYGAECAAIMLDKEQSLFEILANITEAAHTQHDKDFVDGGGEFDMEDWLELMKNTKTDNMGLGIVLYWKRVAWDESDEASED